MYLYIKKMKKEFFRKPITGSYIYRWKPDEFTKKLSSNVGINPGGCNATPLSQGFDNNVKYVVGKIINPNGTVYNLAYVECGYIE